MRNCVHYLKVPTEEETIQCGGGKDEKQHDECWDVAPFSYQQSVTERFFFRARCSPPTFSHTKPTIFQNRLLAPRKLVV